MPVNRLATVNTTPAHTRATAFNAQPCRTNDSLHSIAGALLAAQPASAGTQTVNPLSGEELISLPNEILLKILNKVTSTADYQNFVVQLGKKELYQKIQSIPEVVLERTALNELSQQRGNLVMCSEPTRNHPRTALAIIDNAKKDELKTYDSFLKNKQEIVSPNKQSFLKKLTIPKIFNQKKIDPRKQLSDLSKDTDLTYNSIKESLSIQFSWVGRDLRNDSNFMKIVLMKNSGLYDFSSDRLKNSESFNCWFVSERPYHYSELNENMRDNLNVLSSAYKKAGPDSNNIAHSSDRIKNDLESMIELVKNHPDRCLEFNAHAGQEVKNNPLFFREILKIYPRMIINASPQMKNNDEIATFIKNKFPTYLYHLNERFYKN